MSSGGEKQNYFISVVTKIAQNKWFLKYLDDLQIVCWRQVGFDTRV